MRMCVAPSHKRNLVATIFDDFKHAKVKTQNPSFPYQNPAEVLLDFAVSSDHQRNGFSQIPLRLTPLQFIGILFGSKN